MTGFIPTLAFMELGWKLAVVRPHIGDIIAYQHGLHFCQEAYPYRNQNKV
jgi:hypothetical protein